MFRFRELGFCIVSACEVKAAPPPTGEGTLVRELCPSVLPSSHHSRSTAWGWGDGAWGAALAAGVSEDHLNTGKKPDPAGLSVTLALLLVR